MSIRSEEVNYLVYRYLQESGFQHTAFSFAYESMVADTKVYDEYLPPGSLVTLLQKALQYIEMESHVHINSKVTDCVAPFSLIYPHKCVIRKKEHKSKVMEEPGMESKEILPENVKQLNGHVKKVYSCKWSPTADTLATNSADSTIRLWEDERTDAVGTPVSEMKAGPIMSHSVMPTNENDITSIDWSNDGQMLVSASYDGEVRLWSSNGSSIKTLATYQQPVFNVQFSPNHQRILIAGALPSAHVLEVTPQGDITKDWDATSMNALERAVGGVNEFPANAIILDACWRSDDELTLVDNCNRILHIALNSVITNPTPSFLSSSSSSLWSSSPSSSHAIQIMAGHEQEITSVCWNLDRSVLLSSSEDGTIKVWNPHRSSFIQEFLQHSAEVNCVIASKSSPSMCFSNDKTVKIFDLARNTMTTSWSHHEMPVTHVTQGNGDYQYLLASAGIDRQVNFYDMRTNDVVRTYQSPEYIHDISFNRRGDRFSIALVNSQINVLDLRL